MPNDLTRLIVEEGNTLLDQKREWQFELFKLYVQAMGKMFGG